MPFHWAEARHETSEKKVDPAQKMSGSTQPGRKREGVVSELERNFSQANGISA
jgi:hypothetical protein